MKAYKPSNLKRFVILFYIYVGDSIGVLKSNYIFGYKTLATKMIFALDDLDISMAQGYLEVSVKFLRFGTTANYRFYQKLAWAFHYNFANANNRWLEPELKVSVSHHLTMYGIYQSLHSKLNIKIKPKKQKNKTVMQISSLAYSIMIQRHKKSCWV